MILSSLKNRFRSRTRVAILVIKWVLETHLRAVRVCIQILTFLHTSNEMLEFHALP